MHRAVILAPVFLALLTAERTWGDEEPGSPELRLPPPARVQINHERHIAPILAKRCYRCHGPEKQKAGLRLDVREPALAGGDTGPVIVPGKSAQSILIQRVSSRDPDEVMPPKGKPLSRDEIGLLRAWIDQGAGWADPLAPEPGGRRRQSDHWSFQNLLEP